MTMMYGYSSRIVTINKKANGHLLGVQLGRECMRCNIPVTQVARELKASRQTIYNWFCGEYDPCEGKAPAVAAYIARLKKSK